MSTKARKDKREFHRRDIERRLVPGGGTDVYESLRSETTPQSSSRWRRYTLLSSMSSAIRERAADQSLSADRSDTSSATAVSDVVRPAK